MIELPDSQSQEVIADWIELTLSIYEEDLSRGYVSNIIEGSVGVEPEDYLLDGVWNELAEREKNYISKPFEIETLKITNKNLNPLSKVVHQACLILSLFGSKDKEMQNLFETISHCAIQKYVCGKSQVFAWRGGDIEARMRRLATTLGEDFVSAPRKVAKDAGVDVIAWKPFGDNRTGQLVLLAQCASGANWSIKHPVPLRRWNQYLRWANDPIDGYTIPYFISNGEWHDVCRTYGVFFDRVRIVNLLSDVLNKKLERRLINWINNWLKDNEIS